MIEQCRRLDFDARVLAQRRDELDGGNGVKASAHERSIIQNPGPDERLDSLLNDAVEYSALRMGTLNPRYWARSRHEVTIRCCPSFFCQTRQGTFRSTLQYKGHALQPLEEEREKYLSVRK